MSGQHDTPHDGPYEEPYTRDEEALDGASAYDTSTYESSPYEDPYAQDPCGAAPDHDLAVAAGAAWADQGRPDDRRDGSGFHPVNVTHLVLGIAFLAFAGIWAALTADVVESDDLRWLLPVPWLLAGSVGLVASVAGRRARLQRQRRSHLHGG